MSVDYKLKREPEEVYDFRPHNHHRERWNFVGSAEAEVIMRQMQYLEFHGWLIENLKVCPGYAKKHKWEKLFGPHAEGFHRTDIILLGGVSEYALFSVLKREHLRTDRPTHKSLQKAFGRITQKTLQISKGVFYKDGQLGTLAWQGEKKLQKLDDRMVKAKDLIEAGCAIGIYDESFREELQSLNDQRNSIHLASHWQKEMEKEETEVLLHVGPKERQAAMNTVETLWEVLKAHNEMAKSTPPAASSFFGGFPQIVESAKK